MPAPPPPRADLHDTFDLACTFVWPETGLPCQGTKIVVMSLSSGRVIGDVVTEWEGDPNFARCPKCKRHKMKIVRVPERAKPPGPVGFTKVPEE